MGQRVRSAEYVRHQSGYVLARQADGRRKGLRDGFCWEVRGYHRGKGGRAAARGVAAGGRYGGEARAGGQMIFGGGAGAGREG